MKLLSIEPLFKIGDFEVNSINLTIFILILILIIAVICYRFNHRKQTKAALYMDNECGIYNEKGLEKYLNLKHKKFSNPTIVVVHIKNLNYLYVNYSNHDLLMYKITDMLLAGLDKLEIVSRIGFNKFVIVYDNKSKEQIKNNCLEIENRIDNLVLPNYGKYNFYVSYGIYENAPLANSHDVIIKAASIIDFSTIKDNNLYYYSQEVNDSIEMLKRMNQEKDADLEQKRFIPYIQPKVNFRTGKVIGGEILVRWVNENNEIKYSPKDFIPLFESNGFIKKVDEAMLNCACALAQSFVMRGNNDIVISCNISKAEFNSTNFVQNIVETVSQYQITPKNIEIEITETTVMENLQYVSNCIMELRQLGFSVAMDDFGKEYSSLGSLSQNPFDTIKLDMVFFKDKLSTEKSKNIVSNLLNMLKKINYHVVCEGIEDKQTLDVLATINRDVDIQGYVFSKPIPTSQFEAFAATTFQFDYPEIEEQPTNVVYSNNNATRKADNSEIEAMKLQMLEMQKMFQQSLEEQKQQAYQNEMNSLKQQIEAMRYPQQPQRDYRDDTIDSLRREIEMLKYGSIYKEEKPQNNEIDELKRQIEELKNENALKEEKAQKREIDELKRQIEELRNPTIVEEEEPQVNEIDELKQQINELKAQNNSQQFDVDDLVQKITQAQQNTEANELREQLERERQERLELEKLIQEMEDESSNMTDEEIEKEQELANQKLNLDIDSLSDDDSDSLDDDDEANDDMEKPEYTLAELEGIIQKYMEKYNSDWNQKAKEELKDGYYEIINGLKYYRGKVHFNFNDRIKRASDDVKQLYNMAKNELLQYNGITNKTLSSYDCFYYGKKLIAKLSITKRSVRVYLALDPSQYSERQFPHRDVSAKKIHSKTPYFMMIKSKLSVKRMKMLIEDLMLSEKTKLNEEYSPVDYAAKFKYTK